MKNITTTKIDPVGNRLYVNRTEKQAVEGLIGKDPVDFSGETFILKLEHANRLLRGPVAGTGETELSVQLNADTPFPIGTHFEIIQRAEGPVTILPADDVTISAMEGFNLRLGGQFAVAHLRKIGTDEWILSGNLQESE